MFQLRPAAQVVLREATRPLKVQRVAHHAPVDRIAPPWGSQQCLVFAMLENIQLPRLVHARAVQLAISQV